MSLRPSLAVVVPPFHPGSNARAAGGGLPLPLRPPTAKTVNWKVWLKAVDRRRRLLTRLTPETARRALGRYLARVTHVTFLMDGIDLAERDVAEAFTHGSAHRRVRSRQAQRLRNHLAILRRVGPMARRGQALTVETVVRWYTSISCGLSIARLDGPTLLRLGGVVRQINSPHLNLRPAIEEIARLHAELLADPVVPSFNGILARLLLVCHLERCGLPPLVFDPARDRAPIGPGALVPRMLQLVESSYDALLGCAADVAT